METAISKKKATELERIFAVTSKPRGSLSRINVNSIISDEQETTYSEKSKARE